MSENWKKIQNAFTLAVTGYQVNKWGQKVYRHGHAPLVREPSVHTLSERKTLAQASYVAQPRMQELMTLVESVSDTKNGVAPDITLDETTGAFYSQKDGQKVKVGEIDMDLSLEKELLGYALYTTTVVANVMESIAEGHEKGALSMTGTGYF